MRVGSLLWFGSSLGMRLSAVAYAQLRSAVRHMYSVWLRRSSSVHYSIEKGSIIFFYPHMQNVKNHILSKLQKLIVYKCNFLTVNHSILHQMYRFQVFIKTVVWILTINLHLSTWLRPAVVIHIILYLHVPTPCCYQPLIMSDNFML